MKIKNILTTLTVISVLSGMAVISPGQRVSASPDSPTSFSVFSLPQSIGLPVNSSDNESAGVLSPNGLSLYFSSNRTGSIGSIDLWVSQRATVTSAWGPPLNLTMLNSDSNENLPALSPDGKTLFFNCTCPDSFGGADLYMATRTDPNNDLGWTAPVNLGGVINTPNHEIAASYFEDPATHAGELYLTSDRTGDFDIYQSTRNANGTFNTPTNVAVLNGPSEERGGSVRHDGLEIFITTDRDGGQGGRDIWVSTRASVSASWNIPVNLAAVNSDGNDQSASLSQDGANLYVASSRDGSSDIYVATRVSVNRSAAADFDGDGRSDVSVFRPSDGTWHMLQSGTSTYSVVQFGANGDKVVSGDYDGDGRADAAVFRPSSGNWYVLRSSDGGWSVTNWGITTDKPVPGDYDGDGRTDMAVYRNGTWYIKRSSGGIDYQQFGLSSDIPVASSSQ